MNLHFYQDMLVRILGFVKRELGELLLQKVVSQPPSTTSHHSGTHEQLPMGYSTCWNLNLDLQRS